jgi:hypothetical protein
MNTKTMAMLCVALAGCGVEQPLAQAAPTPQAPTTTKMLYLFGDFIEACGPSPVARGLGLTITPTSVDQAQHALVFAPAEITITDADGTAVPFETLPQSIRTRFPHTGTFVVSGTFADGEVVTREVTVHERVGLRFGPRSRYTVTHGAAGECSSALDEGAPLPSLALNQELNAWVVPVDAQGQALLGTLELEFSGAINSRRRDDPQTNAFTFTPTNAGPSVLTVREPESELELQVPFDVDAAPAVCAGS